MIDREFILSFDNCHIMFMRIESSAPIELCLYN
jgi:hypothetical protein